MSVGQETKIVQKDSVELQNDTTLYSLESRIFGCATFFAIGIAIPELRENYGTMIGYMVAGVGVLNCIPDNLSIVGTNKMSTTYKETLIHGLGIFLSMYSGEKFRQVYDILNQGGMV